VRVATFRVEDACAAFEEAHVHHAHGGRQPHTVASTPSRGCWGWAGRPQIYGDCGGGVSASIPILCASLSNGALSLASHCHMSRLDSLTVVDYMVVRPRLLTLSECGRARRMSGTDALAGSRALSSTFTRSASPNPTLYLGAFPRWLDPHSNLRL
jgi:hypothetical protein